MSRKIWKNTLKEAKKHVKEANVLESDLFEARVKEAVENDDMELADDMDLEGDEN